MAYAGYVETAGKALKGEVDGDVVTIDPFELGKGMLKEWATHRTASGRLSANARTAATELARRKTNAKAKAAAKALEDEG